MYFDRAKRPCAARIRLFRFNGTKNRAIDASLLLFSSSGEPPENEHVVSGLNQT
jgi:hypothetical protein